MPWTLGELAVRFGATLKGDPDAVISHVGSLETAGPDQIAFLGNPKHRRYLQQTRAGAVIVEPSLAEISAVPALLATNPYALFARVAAVLHPPPAAVPGVHTRAVVEPGARVAASASVGAGAFVGADATLAEGVVVGPNCVVMARASVGAHTRLTASVTLYPGVTIGERCILHAGVIIGADGFGFAPENGTWLKVAQAGSVIIGNDVEIGANSTVDRGAIDNTVLEDGVKLDNQIQIGHNVRIGAHTAIAACTGIAGSTVVGKRCMIAGMVGVAGHLEICDDVIITGKSTITGNVTKPGIYSSALPLQEAANFRRNAARFKHLDQLARQVRRLGAGPAKDNSRDESKGDPE